MLSNVGTETTPLPKDILRVRLLEDYLIEYSAYDKDPYESACSSALGVMLADTATELRMASILTKRSTLKHDNLSTWAMHRMLMSACHMIEWSHITENGEDEYSPRHTKSRAWRQDYLDYIRRADENDEDYYKFKSILSWADLNTIKPNRRVASEFLLKSYFADRNEPIDILDVGCSRNDLLLMMALNWGRRSVQLNGPNQGVDYTAHFNEVINGSMPELGQKIGIDIHPYPDDFIYKDWFNSNYLRFQKSHDRELRRIRETLGSQSLRDEVGIEQVSGDFSDDELQIMTSRKNKSQLKDKYDMIIFSFMLYQLNPEKRAVALNRAINMLKPGGIIQLTDIVTVSPNDPLSLRFPDSDKSKAHTLVYQKQREDLGFQEFIEWNDGECIEGTVKDSYLSRSLFE